MFDAMDTTGLDTLKATRTLEAAGFETSQAEALVSVFGGPVAGNAATKGDMRDLRVEMKDLRAEMKTEIAQLRDELKVESTERRADFAKLSREIAEVRGDIKNLKAQMYRLLLVQATVIVGLIVGLQQLF